MWEARDGGSLSCDMTVQSRLLRTFALFFLERKDSVSCRLCLFGEKSSRSFRSGEVGHSRGGGELDFHLCRN
jgi:hypothetical protein